MSKIIVYEGNRRRGSTSNAFNDIVTEELMREYTLSFSIANTDNIFSLISEKSTFGRGGQLFDLTGIDTNTVISNITQIAAEHVSYRLNDYAILPGYAFVGTLKELAQDILNVSENIDTGGHAAEQFKIGNVYNNSDVFSFRMQNTAEATARDALISLQKLGIEVKFDNFTIDIVERRGENRGLTLEYSSNLEETHRVYERGNGWTYDVKAALLSSEYALGDDITIKDALIGTSRSERIITVVDCADDPRQNRIVTGVFILDSATQSVETEKIALDSTAETIVIKKIVEKSVQQEEKYNNVHISHKNGFVAENKAGTQRVVMNADDCFAVQILKNGQWVTVTSTEEWGVLTPRLTTPDAKDVFYVTVGKFENSNGFGLKLVQYYTGEEYVLLEIGRPDGTVGSNAIFKADLPIVFKHNGKGAPIMFENSDGDFGYSGTFSVQEGELMRTIDIDNGLITNIKTIEL